MKHAATLLIGAAGAFLLPVYPYAAICTALAAADSFSAISLRRRLRRLGREVTACPFSLRLWQVIVSLVRIYAALLVAHGVDTVFGLEWCLRFTGAAICFQQALSVLEKEAAAGGAAWAASLRKYLIDKAGRHLS